MARPPTITNEQIIAAAREVFLEKGISATTAEVAKRAGIAEGSIFKRFESKAELFWAAMRVKLGEPNHLSNLTEQASQEELVPGLMAIGASIIDMFRKIVPLMMMSWSNAGGLPEHLREPDPPPLRTLRGLTEHFEKEMARRRMPRRDPELLARVFLASLQSYAFFEILFKAHGQQQMPEKEFLRGLAELLASGTVPGRAAKKPRKKRSRR